MRPAKCSQPAHGRSVNVGWKDMAKPWVYVQYSQIVIEMENTGIAEKGTPLTECSREDFAEALISIGGPGRSRTDGVLSEADYESAACNQHGVRP